MSEFRMPSLGTDMEAGTLTAWLVKVGDRVQRGQVIAEVNTDKGAIEIEVFHDGVVEELVIQPGQKVPVETVLARIREPGESAPVAPGVAALASEPSAARPVGVQVAAPATEPAPAARPVGTPVESVASGPGRVHASPLARRVAADLGVDLSRVQGTGTGGAITREDVERAAGLTASAAPQSTAQASSTAQAAVPMGAQASSAAQGPTAAPVAAKGPAAVQAAVPAAQASSAAQAPSAARAPERPADFAANMRRAIAAAMARSKREIPHYYLETPIDMSRALAWLQAENARRPITERLLPVVLLLKAVARALGDVPELNGFWVDDHLEVRQNVHVGFAVALRQGGLVSPAIHDVDLKGLDELMAAIHDLIPRVRAGRLKSSELSDATITMTNLGDLGVEVVHGIIYPPQVALVGFGRVSERPWAENGMLGIRPVLTATLAGDHRATDGRTGARYLDALNRHLQEPEKL